MIRSSQKFFVTLLSRLFLKCIGNVLYVRLWKERKKTQTCRKKEECFEKKGFDSIIFLVPFDLPFLSNAVLKKSIDETKKKRRVRKSFYFVSKYFFLIDKRNRRIILIDFTMIQVKFWNHINQN